MTASLGGEVAIVTGGASGLGLGIVRKFAEAGADVVIADLNDRDGEQLAIERGPTIDPFRGMEPPRTWPKLRSTSRRLPARPVPS